jgi:hypothetical protein
MTETVPSHPHVFDLPLRMSKAEAALLSEFLSSATFYLEWGAGGSTLAAVRSKARRIVSIETDRAWIERLKEHTEIAHAIKASRVDVRHLDVGAVGEWGGPVSDDKIRNWPRYALEPWIATDFDFDAILIDGRFRVHCLLAAASCAGDRASIFLHDYSFRHSYSIADKYFNATSKTDSAVILKRKTDINYRSLYIDLVNSLFDA